MVPGEFENFPDAQYNKAQDEILQGYIDHRKLDELVEECRRDVVEQLQQQAKAGPSGTQSPGGSGFEHANGHVRAPNGRGDFEIDGGSDEDVEME